MSLASSYWLAAWHNARHPLVLLELWAPQTAALCIEGRPVLFGKRADRENNFKKSTALEKQCIQVGCTSRYYPSHISLDGRHSEMASAKHRPEGFHIHCHAVLLRSAPKTTSSCCSPRKQATPPPQPPGCTSICAPGFEIRFADATGRHSDAKAWSERRLSKQERIFRVPLQGED